MSVRRAHKSAQGFAAAAFLAVGLALAGCSSNALIPPSSGSVFGSPGDTSGLAPPPPLGKTDFTPPGVSPGSNTGTAVSGQINQIRGALIDLQGNLTDANNALQALRGQTIANAQRYNGLVAAISARLQVGTTPGNPVLVSQWNQAQQALEIMNRDIAGMTRVANAVAQDSSRAAYLVESVNATYQLRGAVEEDHRQLRVLQAELNGTVDLIDRLVTEVTDDIARQTAYLANERGNLNTLFQAIDVGQFYGASLGNRSFGVSQAPISAPRAAAVSQAARRPLVVIRFDQPNVAYQAALYNAASQALQRYPNAVFDVVGVTPAVVAPGRSAIAVSSASKNADKVARSLTGMGLPPSRVIRQSQVSPAVQTAEVHVYVR